MCMARQYNVTTKSTKRFLREGPNATELTTKDDARHVANTAPQTGMSNARNPTRAN